MATVDIGYSHILNFYAVIPIYLIYSLVTIPDYLGFI